MLLLQPLVNTGPTGSSCSGPCLVDVWMSPRTGVLPPLCTPLQCLTTFMVKTLFLISTWIFQSSILCAFAPCPSSAHLQEEPASVSTVTLHQYGVNWALGRFLKSKTRWVNSSVKPACILSMRRVRSCWWWQYFVLESSLLIVLSRL